MDTFEKLLADIGNRLIRLRLISGHTSYETFANENKLSRMQYWRIEKGKANLTIKSLVRVLQIHNVTVDAFFAKTFYRNFPVPLPQNNKTNKIKKRSVSMSRRYL